MPISKKDSLHQIIQNTRINAHFLQRSDIRIERQELSLWLHPKGVYRSLKFVLYQVNADAEMLALKTGAQSIRV